MKEDKLREYFSLYTDCWKFFRKYAELIGQMEEEQFWQQAVNESEELFRKYQKSEFAKKMLAATMGELDEIYKKYMRRR